jgi:hypothetical protein
MTSIMRLGLGKESSKIREFAYRKGILTGRSYRRRIIVL